MSGPTILFRCDASAAIGFGHVSRALSVGAALRARGCRVVFLSRPFDAAVRRRVEEAGASWIDLEADTIDGEVTATVQAAERSGASALVTDSHVLVPEYYRAVRARGLPVVSFDDFAGVEYASNVVVNANIGADQLPFRVASDTRVLTGPAYLPLRDAVIRLAAQTRVIRDRVTRVLVALGGMPSPDLTIRVIDGLRAWVEHDAVQVTVVLGIQAPGEVQERVAASLPARARGLVDADVPRLAHDTDLAVVNGSMIAYEAAALGTPSLAIAVAENQRLAVEQMGVAGIAVALGAGDYLTAAMVAESIQALAADVERRRRLSAQAAAVVDGRGAARVADVVMDLASIDHPAGRALEVGGS